MMANTYTLISLLHPNTQTTLYVGQFMVIIELKLARCYQYYGKVLRVPKTLDHKLGLSNITV